ncbi:receptor-like protein kinase [Gossypium australe]|uniref:Receptor-like protein kinase n=1 Tax=Gossypium australe TaxID=47621 RepID=A0A5B6WRF7_9ROSI|nr:receptor-like protein kinase [Gossypium australe]
MEENSLIRSKREVESSFYKTVLGWHCLQSYRKCMTYFTCRYLGDIVRIRLIISAEDVKIQLDLSYEEEPVKILAREVKELRNKRVSLVKVLWRSHNVEEATWESKETMKSIYPHLFSGKFRGRNSF